MWAVRRTDASICHRTRPTHFCAGLRGPCSNGRSNIGFAFANRHQRQSRGCSRGGGEGLCPLNQRTFKTLLQKMLQQEESRTIEMTRKSPQAKESKAPRPPPSPSLTSAQGSGTRRHSQDGSSSVGRKAGAWQGCDHTACDSPRDREQGAQPLRVSPGSSTSPGRQITQLGTDLAALWGHKCPLSTPRGAASLGWQQIYQHTEKNQCKRVNIPRD